MMRSRLVVIAALASTYSFLAFAASETVKVDGGQISVRMLIAQAQIEDLPVVTNDEIFDVYRVTRLW